MPKQFHGTMIDDRVALPGEPIWLIKKVTEKHLSATFQPVDHIGWGLRTHVTDVTDAQFGITRIHFQIASGNFHFTARHLRNWLIVIIFSSGRGQATLPPSLLSFLPPLLLTNRPLLLFQPWSLEHSPTRIIHTAVYHYITPWLLINLMPISCQHW